MKAGERMLPGDYQKKIKYDALDNTEKQVKKSGGFFNFPEKLKGSQDQNKLEFLVFYFDNVEEYEAVRAFFEITTTLHTVHPKLNSKLLYSLVKKETER
jgi:hypothetical protein